MIAGRATPEGTGRFRRRFEGDVAEGHFRGVGGLWLSSIGLGTYLGEADAEADEGYEQAVLAALAAGCNVFDTAVNYRHQRSERAIGRALARAFERGLARRDEVFVSTKGGFLPFDAEQPAEPAGYLRSTYLDTGLVEREDLAAGCHSIAPRYLEDQLARSRANLGLATLDLYYLHNPETQASERGRPAAEERLARAFAWLEEKVGEGAIAAYGAATWDAFRVGPEDRSHLSLERLVELAAAAAPRPGFRAVQLPLNLGMPEALVRPTQVREAATIPALAAARALGLAAFTSASILQGRLARDLPQAVLEALPGLETDAQRALQFTRSAPGVTTALVGMSSPGHVTENLAVARVPPAPPETYRRFFGG